MRVCDDPCCGKELKQQPNERDSNFRRRKYCSRKCSGLHAAAKETKPNINKLNVTTVIAKSEGIGLLHFEPDHHPDHSHSIPMSRIGGGTGVSKTDEEIDRMWEYNRLMGRRN